VAGQDHRPGGRRDARNHQEKFDVRHPVLEAAENADGEACRQPDARHHREKPRRHHLGHDRPGITH
jgi:hypothetical protein